MAARAKAAAGVIALLAVVGAALAIIGSNVPVAPDPVIADPMPASTTYTYSADVPKSPVYNGTTVSSPQPIFRRVIDEVEVRFTHRSHFAEAPATVTVAAELSTQNGWRSTMQLLDPEPVTAGVHQGRVAIDLSAIEARANAAANAISGEPAGETSVVLVTEVTTAQGVRHRAGLPFILDALSFRLAQGDQAALTFHHEAVPVQSAAEATGVSVFGRDIDAANLRVAARAGSIVTALAALVGTIALAVWLRSARRTPLEQLIQRRYAAQLVAVEPIALPAGRPIVDVAEVGDLLRLAGASGAMVLHWARGSVHSYVVLGADATYRYRTGIAPDSVEHPLHEVSPPATSSAITCRT